MDSDAYRARSLVVAALARDGPPPVDGRSLALRPAFIPPSPARTGPPPATAESVPLDAQTRERLSALVGALSLRAVRARYPG